MEMDLTPLRMTLHMDLHYKNMGCMLGGMKIYYIIRMQLRQQ
ncbi:hypothetical protein SAMN05216327_102200 [Dyadobacter sp. SG02]|nr:hypothetical protein SAMN05216327_102200 [Dyadobacter sp. SG02]